MDADKIKTILLFPIKDAYARQQFLVACLLTLAGMAVPIVPLLILMGYGARIARQIVIEKKEPAMTEWDNWNEFLMDGARLFGIRLLFILPVFFLAILGQASIMISLFFVEGNSSQQPSPFGGVMAVIGIAIFVLAFLLAIVVGFCLMAAETHVIAKSSFSAGLQFKEWWPILKNGIGAFLTAYLIMLLVSFAFSFIIGFAIITIVLICILPFILVPYSAYLALVAHALYAQAYASSRAYLSSTMDRP